MTPQPLAYQTPAAQPPTVLLHQIAQLCGVLPLAFGTLIFLMFLATRDGLFVLLGMWTIVGGLGAAFVGVVCAGVYLFQAQRGDPHEHAAARRSGYRDIAIIAMNFPVALVMVLIGAALIPGW
jgi:hypothetical protein